MGNVKVSAFPENTSLALTDIFPHVDDPGGSPVSKYSTFDTLRKLLRGYASKTANYTQVTADRVIAVDATSGAVTITLTAVASLPIGYTVTIKKTDTSANAVIVDANSAELIEGATTQILFTQNAHVTIVNTGTAWIITDSYGLVNGHVFLATAVATVANVDTEQSLIGTGIGNLTLPANVLRAGKMQLHDLLGFISCTGTPTLNIKLKLGSTVIAATGAVTLESGLTLAVLSLRAILRCVTVGSPGTVIASGMVGIGTKVFNLYPVSGAAVNVDTATALAIGITGQWGTADPANTLSVPTVAIMRAN
jgi:hypothetical protein